ncbi:hypothetical protein D9758_009159 [Tetrapyrgos nigripes]|uniref:RRM domain-containing protein n=1 Tax=Tetrapyrgos nigripes TaxID=182062 RepID=A0A8H5G8E7_9AGAR|nr:hypothetical protein D9758_009159 [Tetrapyrgos nigripes]
MSAVDVGIKLEEEVGRVIPPPVSWNWAITQTPPQPSLQKHEFAAVALGGSRHFYIHALNGDPDIDCARIVADFSPFGLIERVHVDQSRTQAWFSFMEIPSAFHAIEEVSRNNRNFSLYAGGSLTFQDDKRAHFFSPVHFQIVVG